MNPTLVINAGGESRRMGQPKALLPVPPDNRPLIAHIAQRLSTLSPQRIVVVANEPEVAAQAQIPGHVEFIPDRYSGAGTLGGIATALYTCEGWAILVACDMPLVNPAVFEMLCAFAAERDAENKADRWDAVVPYVDGYAQTLHALYHRRCLPAIEARLAADQLKVIRFFDDVRVRWVTEDEVRPLEPTFRSFMNTNTPDEWAQALAIMEETA